MQRFRQGIVLITLYLFPISMIAQAIIGKTEKNSVRINVYTSLLSGKSGEDKIGGKSGTIELLNYHFQNVLQYYQITSGTNDYKINSLKNEFTWHAGKYFKLKSINSFSYAPLNSYSYIVNYVRKRPNAPIEERIDRVKVNTKDQYTQNGGQLSFKFNNNCFGGQFIYTNRSQLRKMTASQYAFTFESNTLKKVSLKATAGLLNNSFFKEKMNYVETELRLHVNRNLKFFVNGSKGNTRMYYSMLDGGFTLFSEDVLNSVIGIKAEFNFAPNFGGFVKAEKYNFKNSNLNFFYLGLSYKIKPY